MNVRICQWQPVGIEERIDDPDSAERAAKQITEHKSDKRAGEPDDQRFDDEDRAHGELREPERFHDRDVARLFMGDGGNDVEGPETGDEQNRADHRIHDDVANDERRKEILIRFFP